jgi:hypothetical protein
MMFLVCFLFPSIRFFSDIFNSKTNEKLSKSLIFSFAVSFILNALAAIYQGIFNIHFLTQGSGTSLDAQRAPGLLDDSGVASFFFAITGFIFIALIFNKYINIKYKITSFILFILNLISGISNNSRTFFIGLFSSILILLIIKTIENLINKKYKLILGILSISTFATLVIYFISMFKSLQGLSRLQSIFYALSSRGTFFERYALIDEQRAAHLQIMWVTIKEHFYTGTGLGSFASNFYTQYNKLNLKNISLDIPTNTYLSLISELGLVGLLLIIFSLFLKKGKNNLFFGIFIIIIRSYLGMLLSLHHF